MKPWSYSSLTDFEGCPKRYNLVRVQKLAESQETEATRWGTEVHRALEMRIRDGTPLPETLAYLEPYAAKFDNKGAFTELELALTKDLQPTTWDAPDVWWRGVIDVGVCDGKRAVLGDWKTGKPKNDHDQLKLFAAAYMTLHPEVESCRTLYIWLAHNKTTRKDIAHADVDGIWAEFRQRASRLENAFELDRWPAKPSGLCNGWCPCEGLCSHWKPRKK